MTCSVLYVGEDLCFRIPIMEAAGLTVHSAPCSPDGLEAALAADGAFSVLTFQFQAQPLPDILPLVRRRCSAPLVLFETVHSEELASAFDLVIPPQTRPLVWLKTLQEVAADSARLREQSRQLREHCAEVRSHSRRLREFSRRNTTGIINPDDFWRG